MDINGFLTTKRFGAPTWVWIAGAVAVGSFVVLKMRSSKNTAASGDQGIQAAGTGTWSTSKTDSSGNTTSSSFTGPAYSPGFLTNQATLPPVQQGGDTYINGGSPQPTVPSALADIPTSTYTVKGATTPSDQWPGGVAIAAYQLNTTDAVDIAFYAVDIQLLNPGLMPPYPVGTNLTIPTNLNKTTHTSPYPQTTSTTG